MKANLSLLFVALLVAIGLYALYDRIEFYKTTEEGPWSEAALRNPFLAAQRYLEEQQVVVRSDAELSSHDDLVASGTLVLMRSAAIKDKQLADKILQWVENGGHLIVASGSNNADDLVLKRFHITQQWVRKSTEIPKAAAPKAETKPAPAKSNADEYAEKKLSQRLREYNERIKQDKKPQDSKNSQCPVPDPTDLTDVQLPGNQRNISVAFANYSVLQQPYFTLCDKTPAHDVPKPVFFIGNKSGVHLAQFSVGAGKLTVLSDINIWTYKAIADHDHALLLDALIDHTHAVHFLYGVNMPDLTTLLWRNAYEAVCASILLLLAGLIYRSRRFGSILDLPRDQRRASSEHWLAAARYQWQHHQGDALLAAARESINKKAALQFPGFAQWPAAEQIATLSAVSKLSNATLHTALHAPLPVDSDRFCDCITTLQLLGTRL